MSAAVETSGRAAPSRTLTVRRPLAASQRDGQMDRRRIMQTMRRWLVRRTLTLGLVLVALAMAMVWVRLQVTEIGYQLSAARQMQDRLEQQRRELEIELATLRDRTHLADVASKRLGMRDPDKGQVVELR
jgi:cell division protein FtsL